MLRGGESVTLGAAAGMNQMDVQQPAYLSVEVHLATLNAATKEGAWVDVENSSSQSQTIRLNKASNVDSVTDFHLSHGSLFQIDSAGKPKIMPCSPMPAKNFLRPSDRVGLYIVLRRCLFPLCLNRL